MESKIGTLPDYRIFSSLGGDRGDLEERAKKLLSEKETSENLRLFGQAIAVDWKKSDDNVAALRLTFSDFEKIMDRKKVEITRHLNDCRKNTSGQKNNSYDSSTF